MNGLNREWILRTIVCSLGWSGRTAMASAALMGMCTASDGDAQVTTGLSYSPRQPNVVYEKVAAKEAANCKSKYETQNGIGGLLISNAEDQPLRRFLDTNGDRNVDQWCYYKDGIEVYRDIDSDFNGIADQYRWLGTSGTRWGIDANEDGKIDSWKYISAEEVTMEVVDAIKGKDEERFKRLLVSENEQKQLGLGDGKNEQLTERLNAARTGFGEFLRSQKIINQKSKWTHFSADKPGVVPAGTEGSTQDLTAYENVIAIVENDTTSQQLMVGTLVQFEGSWRLADLPRIVSEGDVLAESGFFFTPGSTNRSIGVGIAGQPGMSPLLIKLEEVDNKLRTPGPKSEELHEERANILNALIQQSRGTDDMGPWVSQFADSVSAAAQTGEYPGGFERLKKLESYLIQNQASKDLMAYVSYRTLTTEHAIRSSEKDADYNKIQRDLMKNLETFAETYPTSTEAADAMVQIALNLELAADEREAKVWYQRVADKFPDTNLGSKAAGAINRLSLEGRGFSISGKTLAGKPIDTKRDFAGAPVIIHFWATWCEPCKKDMEDYRKLQAKFKNLQVVGINLDSDASVAEKFLKSDRSITWPQVHATDGFESELAIKYGVLSVPVTILVDGSGRVIKRTSHYSPEMTEAIEALSSQPVAQRPAPPPKQPSPPTQSPRGAQQQPPKNKK